MTISLTGRSRYSWVRSTVRFLWSTTCLSACLSVCPQYCLRVWDCAFRCNFAVPVLRPQEHPSTALQRPAIPSTIELEALHPLSKLYSNCKPCLLTDRMSERRRWVEAAQRLALSPALWRRRFHQRSSTSSVTQLGRQCADKTVDWSFRSVLCSRWLGPLHHSRLRPSGSLPYSEGWLWLVFEKRAYWNSYNKHIVNCSFCTRPLSQNWVRSCTPVLKEPAACLGGEFWWLNPKVLGHFCRPSLSRVPSRQPNPPAMPFVKEVKNSVCVFQDD